MLTPPVIVPPSSNALGERYVTFQGHFADSTNAGTRLVPDAAFPSGRYAIECNTNLTTNTETVHFRCDGFQFNGREFARHTNGLNIFGGSTVIDFGGIKLSHAANSKWQCQISNIFGTYLWRGIHLMGQVWFSNFWDWHFIAPNQQFDGDDVIILENGGHFNGGSNPTVKANHFRNIKATIAGIYKSFLRMKSGNYNHFVDIFPDGAVYRDAIFNLDNSDVTLDAGYIMGGNEFDHLQTLDVNTEPTPDNRKGGTLYLNGSNVVGNTFRGCRLPKYPNTVKIAGGAGRNNTEISGHYGSTATIDDQTADPSNTIEIEADFKITPGTVPIVSTHSIVRIIDKRGNAARDGATSVSDGGTVTHNLATTPKVVMVTGRVAGEIATVTARTTTTFTVAIKKHDGTPGTTQIVDWFARI